MIVLRQKIFRTSSEVSSRINSVPSITRKSPVTQVKEGTLKSLEGDIEKLTVKNGKRLFAPKGSILLTKALDRARNMTEGDYFKMLSNKLKYVRKLR